MCHPRSSHVTWLDLEMLAVTTIHNTSPTAHTIPLCQNDDIWTPRREWEPYFSEKMGTLYKHLRHYTQG